MKKGVIFDKKLNGSKLKVGIALARWNNKVTDALLEDCVAGLLDAKVKKKNILVQDVPGSYELPFAAHSLILHDKVDVVVCIGTLIKGETMHFEYIADAVSQGIMKLQLESGVPVVFGVLTCLDKKQALERSVGKKSHAYDWGLTAVEMAFLK